LKINSNTDEQVTRFWTKIGLMAEITSVFRTAPARKETYEKALGLIGQVIPFKAVSLFLKNSKKNVLVEVVRIGDKFNHNHFSVIKPDFISWAKHQADPIRLSYTDNRSKEKNDESQDVLIVPLVVENIFIGTVVYSFDLNFKLRDNDFKLLSIIGDHLALSIERMLYQRRLEEKNLTLEKAREGIDSIQNQIIDDERLAAVKELAASINHEINNPLSIISGNVEFLLFLQKNLDEKTISRLKIIESETYRIAEINRRLLDIQNIVTEAYRIDSQKIEMLNLFKSTIGAGNE